MESTQVGNHLGVTREVNGWHSIALIIAAAAIMIASAEGSEMAAFVGGPLVLGAFMWLFREHGWTTVLCAAVMAAFLFVPYLAD